MVMDRCKKHPKTLFKKPIGLILRGELLDFYCTLSNFYIDRYNSTNESLRIFMRVN